MNMVINTFGINKRVCGRESFYNSTIEFKGVRLLVLKVEGYSYKESKMNPQSNGDFT